MVGWCSPLCHRQHCHQLPLKQQQQPFINKRQVRCFIRSSNNQKKSEKEVKKRKCRERWCNTKNSSSSTAADAAAASNTTKKNVIGDCYRQNNHNLFNNHRFSDANSDDNRQGQPPPPPPPPHQFCIGHRQFCQHQQPSSYRNRIKKKSGVTDRVKSSSSSSVRHLFSDHRLKSVTSAVEEAALKRAVVKSRRRAQTPFLIFLMFILLSRSATAAVTANNNNTNNQLAAMGQVRASVRNGVKSSAANTALFVPALRFEGIHRPTDKFAFSDYLNWSDMRNPMESVFEHAASVYFHFVSEHIETIYRDFLRIVERTSCVAAPNVRTLDAYSVSTECKACLRSYRNWLYTSELYQATTIRFAEVSEYLDKIKNQTNTSTTTTMATTTSTLGTAVAAANNQVNNKKKENHTINTNTTTNQNKTDNQNVVPFRLYNMTAREHLNDILKSSKRFKACSCLCHLTARSCPSLQPSDPHSGQPFLLCPTTDDHSNNDDDKHNDDHGRKDDCLEYCDHVENLIRIDLEAARERAKQTTKTTNTLISALSKQQNEQVQLKPTTTTAAAAVSVNETRRDGGKRRKRRSAIQRLMQSSISIGAAAIATLSIIMISLTITTLLYSLSVSKKSTTTASRRRCSSSGAVGRDGFGGGGGQRRFLLHRKRHRRRLCTNFNPSNYITRLKES